MNLAQAVDFEPITVEIEPERVATASVDQRVYLVASSERFPVLMDLLNDPEVESVIIFANRRDQVRRLYEKAAQGRCPLRHVVWRDYSG
jgi:ATP-dependent RNA helicase RhlB